MYAANEYHKGAIVILSGGLDSLVSLYLTLQKRNVSMAITFDYGQKAAVRERQVAKYHCDRLGIHHQIIDLPWLRWVGTSSLQTGAIPLGNQVDLDNLEISRQTAASVWVPNRNGLFIEVAAVYADAYGLGPIILGFNAEEAVTFSDNSKSFVAAINQSLQFSTRSGVRVESPLIDLNKMQIMTLAKELFSCHELWSCYQDGERLCGLCESCQRLKRSVMSIGLNWEEYVTRNEIFIRSL